MCPSCKSPLVAKQGNQKEWHFAHATRGAVEQDLTVCEYSFAVSVRLMLLQLAADGLAVRTPTYSVSGEIQCPLTNKKKHIEVPVTEESTVNLEQPQLEAMFSGTRVDILSYISGYPFIVYLSHKGRSVPDSIRKPGVEEFGCIVLYLDNLQQYMSQEKRGRYSQALRSFVADSTSERHWLVHPRETRVIEILNGQLEIWLTQQEKEYYKGKDPASYRCAMCKATWCGYSRECESCGTHLYTSERRPQS